MIQLERATAAQRPRGCSLDLDHVLECAQRRTIHSVPIFIDQIWACSGAMANHYSDKCKPFRFSSVISVEGGWLSKPVALPTIQVDGDNYATATRKNRELAKVLGLDLKACDPFDKTALFTTIAKMRDDAVDSMIMTHEIENAPMTDSTDIGKIGGGQLRYWQLKCHSRWWLRTPRSSQRTASGLTNAISLSR